MNWNWYDDIEKAEILGSLDEKKKVEEDFTSSRTYRIFWSRFY